MPRNTACAPNSTLTLSNSTSGAFGIGVSGVIRLPPEFRRLQRRARRNWMTTPFILASATPQAAGKSHQPQRVPTVMGAFQEQRQEEIEHQDGHERQHEGLGGGPTDAFSPGPAAEAAMTGHQRQRPAAKDRLSQVP